MSTRLVIGSIILLVAVVWSLDAPEAVATTAAAAPAAVSPTAAPAVEPEVCETFESEAILDLVREHRRGADEPFARELVRAIHDESLAAGVDPLLVASIVASESSFRHTVVSRAGAVGLMQLRPFVAREVAGKCEIEWNGTRTLETPELNIRLGVDYYKYLLGRFDGDARAALTAYNEGPTRVRRKMNRGTYSGSRYAERILDLYGALADSRPGDATSDCGPRV